MAYTVAYEDSEDGEDSRIMNAVQHPRWFDAIFTFSGVQVKIHELVTPLGRQLNGCLGTIVVFVARGSAPR